MKKIITIFAMASVALMTVFSCGKEEAGFSTTNPLPMPEVQGQALQGLVIAPKTNYVVVGEELDLTLTYQPEDAAVSSVEWTSSDPEIATVDAKGHVVAQKKTGIAMITAKAEGKSITAIVNVFAERVPATEIKLNKTEITLLTGRATQVRATLLPDGTGEDGVATTDKLNLEWSSSDENVAIVSYGFVQAKGMGEATITAKQGELTATVKVTVADKIKLQDRSEAWKITDTPKWDKNWSGQITGSHVQVDLAECDAELHYFKVVAADKFTGIEEISNDVYTQVEEYKDGGKDPKSLFQSGATGSVNYSDLGEAVAYVLGYDSECEFTGEYAVYNFEGRTPDPVHATGIQFTSGWGGTVIDKIELKEGKSLNMFSAKLLPDDCTDTGSISFKSSDESVVVLKPYYSDYYTVTAVASGEAEIIATFNDLTASIPVVVSGGSVVWTDKSSEWTGSFGDIEQWGSTYFGFTLTSCTSPQHYMFMAKAASISGDLVAYMKSTAAANEEWLSYYAQSDIPDQTYDWSGSKDDEYYAFVVGVTADGSSFDGNYAIFHYDPNGGGDQPGGGDEPGEGKMVSMSNNYFSVTWDASDKDQDEVTMEGWVYGDSFSGNASGNDGLASMMGVEGVFLIRLQNGKPEVVYGGTQKSNGEYNEKKVTCSTTLADKEWHHIAATYKRAGDVILYIDGEEAGRNTAEDHEIKLNGVGAGWAGGGLADWHFYIGVSCQTSRDFDGSLAYLRVWDCARSASEIKDNMSVADPDDEGYNLLASWYFNEGSGNTIADKSGYGYNLTANSTLTWVDGTLPF